MAVDNFAMALFIVACCALPSQWPAPLAAKQPPSLLSAANAAPGAAASGSPEDQSNGRASAGNDRVAGAAAGLESEGSVAVLPTPATAASLTAAAAVALAACTGSELLAHSIGFPAASLGAVAVLTPLIASGDESLSGVL